MKKLLGYSFSLVIDFLRAHPYLKVKVRNWFSKYPFLEGRLKMLATGQELGHGDKEEHQSEKWPLAFASNKLIKRGDISSLFVSETKSSSSKEKLSLFLAHRGLAAKKISIILLTWNGLAYTKQCLESLQKKTKFDNYEIIVVDNGSTDGTVEYIESLKAITIIKNKKNLGFTKGNNIGIRFASDSDIVLLNNDIVVTQDDWLERMQHAAYQDDSTGIVGCRLVDEKEMFLHSGTFIYPETYWGQQIGSGQTNVNQYNSIREVEGVVFACVYIKREVIEKVGLLDEDYFAYFEDTDYCLKAKGKGYKTVCAGDVTMIHYQNVSTSGNKLSFLKLFKKSRSTFKKKWSGKLTLKYNKKIAWHSIVNFPSGYAVSSKNIMLALDRHDVDVRYKYVYGRGTPFPVEEHKNSHNYIINIIQGRLFDNNLVQVVYGQGDVFLKNNGRYKIGYTMLEVTGIPKTWVDSANQMDEIWVPSNFNVETFRNSGVKVPIHNIPLGIDPDFFNPKIKSFKQTDKFIFLSVFEWGERKSPRTLLRSFSQTFKKTEDVTLVCKIINNDLTLNILEEISKMELPTEHPPIIFIYNQPVRWQCNNISVVYNREIPDYEMGALYRSANCFVLPTRGEGWGMPILEAMACGLPVIATNWSAQTEFMNDKNSYLLRTRALIDAKAKCPYYKNFQWADPDEEHLQYLMRYVYEHKTEAQEKGLIASEEVLKNWTWDNSANCIIKRLEEISGE
jgi:hypothetical protein